MSYHESEGEFPGTVKVVISCDARKGKGICGSTAEVTMNDLDLARKFIYAFGFRLLRGHQACSDCLGKKNVVFPRIRKEGQK